MNNKSKRIILAMLIVLSGITLTGCKSQLTIFMEKNYATMLDERATQNVSILETLYSKGLMTERTKNSIQKQIETQIDNIKPRKDNNGEWDQSSIDSLSKATTAFKIMAPYYIGYCEDDADANNVTRKSVNPRYESYNNKSINYGKSTIGIGVTAGTIDGGTTLNGGYDITSIAERGKNSQKNTYSAFCLGNYVYANTYNKPYTDELLDNFPFTIVKNGSGKHLNQVTDWIKRKDLVDSTNLASTNYAMEHSINLIGGNNAANIQDALETYKVPIYVLDPNLMAQNNATMAEIMAAVDASKNGDYSGLQQYFSPLTNNSATLLPDNFNLVRLSRDNFDSTVNKPGYDLVLSQEIYTGASTAYNEPVATIRFYEFDSVAAESLQTLLGDDKYIVAAHPGNNGNAVAYLMEYPISVLGQMTESLNHPNTINCLIEEDTDLGINLCSKKFIEYDYSGSRYTTRTIDTDNSYLKFNFNTTSDSIENTCLVSKGTRKYTIYRYQTDNNNRIRPGGDKVEIDVPNIVLTDYLEATWAPGSTSYTDENIAVFGRKIRVLINDSNWKKMSGNEGDFLSTPSNYSCDYYLSFSTKQADKFAKFVDINGEEVGSLQKLNITDICNNRMLVKKIAGKAGWEAYKNAHFRLPGQSKEIIKQCTADPADTAPLLAELEETTDIISVYPVFKFPGDEVGVIDKNNKGAKVQPFYCMITTKGMFESNLFDDWINSSSSTESLAWWNQFLSDSGYKYTIDYDGLIEYLKSKYTYEMQKNGYVLLDLDVIKNIQEQLEKDSNKNRVGFIRTLSILIGLILVGYAMLLPLCWILDTHFDLGFTLLNKLTFGSWVAVAYKEDIPTTDTTEHLYLTFLPMLSRASKLVVIGVILMRVDIVHIVLVLVKYFGGIGEYVIEMVNGKL